MEAVKKHRLIFWLKWLIALCIIIWLTISWYAFSHSNPRNCKEYTRIYSSIKEFYFDKKKYSVEVCDLGGYGGMEKSLIRIYRENGKQKELLARRTYYDGGADPIYVGVSVGTDEDKNKIRYIGVNENDYSTIDIPPTKLDWLLAQLP
jgi:hypothetical protein